MSACRHGFTESSGATPLSTVEPSQELGEREVHRDFRKPAHWSQTGDAAARAEALDVRIAVDGKLFDCRVQTVHCASVAPTRSEEVGLLKPRRFLAKATRQIAQNYPSL